MSEVRLEPILKRNMNDFLKSLNFSMVAKVTGIDNLSSGFVNVQPIVNDLTSDIKDIPFSEIKDVPLQVQSTKAACVTLPISIGDEVTLIFPQTSIQEYKYGLVEQHDQTALDGFKLHNAIAFIGTTNTTSTPYSPLNYNNSYDNQNINIVMNKGSSNECSVVINSSGDIINTSNSIINDVKNIDNTTALINVDNDIIIRGVSLYAFITSHMHNYTDDGNMLITSPPIQGA